MLLPVLCHAYVTQRTKDNDNYMRKCVKKNCNELFFLCISNNLYCNTIHLGWDRLKVQYFGNFSLHFWPMNYLCTGYVSKSIYSYIRARITLIAMFISVYRHRICPCVYLSIHQPTSMRTNCVSIKYTYNILSAFFFSSILMHAYL